MTRPAIPRSASVAVALLLLGGCATQPVDVPVLAPPRAGVPPVPAPPASGQVAARAGRPGFVVAAQGGREADDMAVQIAQRTGFGLVVAGEASAAAPRALEQRVLEVAQGPLRFYAELTGSGRRDCAGRIEIATVGVDRELALRWRTLAELIRDAYLRGNGEVQRVDVLIEPADPVAFGAGVTRREGVLRLPERGLHIELPRCARRDWRETYSAILADFLAQAGTLPVGR